MQFAPSKNRPAIAGCNLFVWFVCLLQKFQLHEKISGMVPFHKKAKVSNNLANLRVIVLTSHTRKCRGGGVDHLTRQVCVFQDPICIYKVCDGRQHNSAFTSQQFAVTLRPLPVLVLIVLLRFPLYSHLFFFFPTN